MTQPIRLLELCAGIGGFGLAAEMVGGYQVVGQVEIDRFCQAVLAKHWPDVQRMGDIREVVGDEFGEVNVVCAGFPCQPSSQAGKRRGRSDDRWLWPEIARVVRTAQPRWIVLENVDGLRSVDAGGGFADVLRDLAALGYRVGWGVWGAADVGAPHQRDRVFIVGYMANPKGALRQRGPQGQTGFTLAGDAMADADSDRRGNGAHQPESGAECGGSANASVGRELADSDSSGRGSHERDLQAGQRNVVRIGVGQADAHCARLPQRDGCDATRGACAATGGDGAGQTQSGVCRGADGLPSGLYGHRWPAGPGSAQYPWEAPRVTTARIPNRPARLKALGNAICPQQVAPLLAAIVEWEATA